MIKQFAVYAKSVRENSGKQEDYRLIRAFDKAEARRKAHAIFSRGGWSRGEYTITKIEEVGN